MNRTINNELMLYRHMQRGAQGFKLSIQKRLNSDNEIKETLKKAGFGGAYNRLDDIVRLGIEMSRKIDEERIVLEKLSSILDLINVGNLNYTYLEKFIGGIFRSINVKKFHKHVMALPTVQAKYGELSKQIQRCPDSLLKDVLEHLLKEERRDDFVVAKQKNGLREVLKIIQDAFQYIPRYANSKAMSHEKLSLTIGYSFLFLYAAGYLLYIFQPHLVSQYYGVWDTSTTLFRKAFGTSFVAHPDKIPPELNMIISMF
ncbi:hypothetical protein JXA85_07575 [Candidatus Woesearchaeota archaeon]|nr:hypothetical protein [Candidatus Woesearchaeota archaeon]